MSSTGRGAVREPHDFYATPAWCVHRLLEKVRLPGGRWLEPCAGDGAIIRATRALRADVAWSAVELRQECAPALERVVGDRHVIGNYFDASIETVDVILTNPPYSLAHEFLRKALENADHVVMLLRLDYLGSSKRAAFFHQMPPDFHVLPNRPVFVKGRTDSCEYGWFVWGPDRRRAHGTVSVLGVTPLRDRCRSPSVPSAAGERTAAPSAA